MSWKLYVVKCNDHSLYTGITTDIERRLFEHNYTKKGARYTKSRRPVVLVFQEDCDNKSDASKKESKFKKLSRNEKLQQIHRD